MATGTGPRLYFTADELSVLQARCATGGFPGRALAGMAIDAHLWGFRPTGRPDHHEWIAPHSEDPVYENLYDRFWAIMFDAALLEHLALTACLSGDEQITRAAVGQLVHTARRWSSEATLTPDYGTAYATTRLVKALAVGYDSVGSAAPDPARRGVLDVLVACTRQLADQWFSRAKIRGPVGTDGSRHSPHHSSVEWSGFGIAALCLLGEVPDAERWVADVERQLTEHLLPGALDKDGSAPEGTDFWASTVLSQLQVLDPLRRVTGTDLLTEHARNLNPSLGLAVYQPRRTTTPDCNPHYGPSTGLAAVLSALARERGDARLAAVAAHEGAPGRLDIWPARTPNRGELMLMSAGAYAALWYPADEAVSTPDAPLSLGGDFPQAHETYIRSGWGPGSFTIAVRRGKVSAWVDEVCAFTDLTPETVIDVEESRRTGSGVFQLEPAGLEPAAVTLHDDGLVATVTGMDDTGTVQLLLTIDRDRRTARIERFDGHERRWYWGSGRPGEDPERQPAPSVIRGTVSTLTPDGFRPDLRAGYGLLDVVPTDPRSYPVAIVRPQDGRIEIGLDLSAGEGKKGPGGKTVGTREDRT